MSRRSIAALAAVAASLAASGDASAAASPTGGLSQLVGRGGCIYDPAGGSAQGQHVDLPGRCGSAASLDGAHDAVVSPDGRHVYVAAFSADSISVFRRNAATGRLSQLGGADGCVVEDPFQTRCASAAALDGVAALAVSPDGRSVYAASYLDGAVAAFSRDRTSGTLTQVSCLSDSPLVHDCEPAAGIFGASSVAVSPDGRNVYVTGTLSHAVGVFARDRGTGALRQLPGAAACVRDGLIEVAETDTCARTPGLEGATAVAVSPDGRSVYVTALGSAAVAVFARGASGALTPAGCLSDGRVVGPCAAARSLEGAFAVSVSRDGRNVYVATGFDRRGELDAFATSGIAVFARDRVNGALQQLSGRAGCVTQGGSRGCANGRALEGSADVAVSPDGRNVYVSAGASNAIGIFARDPKNGALRQLAGTRGCVSETGNGGGCRDATGLWGAASVAVSPDGRHAYTPSFFSSAVVVFARTPAPRRGGR